MKTRISTTGKCAGFTLIEILVTMAIIAVAASVIAPHMEGFFESAESRSVQRRISNLLLAARETAITSEEKQVVTLKGTEFTFQDRVIDLGEFGFEAEEEKGEISYYSDGTSSGGNFSLIYREDEARILEIEKITGKPEWRVESE